jgi:O-antigen/teichoic acid export membrane protein
MRMSHQAAVLSVSRIANYGLMIISPVILVRLLTVIDFGRYREFLLYASLLQTTAAFAIGESLLYFIPRHPESLWRVVRQTMILTAVVSSCVVGAFVAVDLLVPGGLVGPYLVPVALYVILFVNVDYWENLWLATRRPLPVFAYTAGRLMARLLVVVCVAVVTGDVTAIIWSLIVLELLRFSGSLIAWNRADRSRFEPPIVGMSRQQLRFCMPFGLATVLSMISRNLGNVVIAKYLGAAALAQLTIGIYGEPIVLALRNSISTVVLPELVRLGGRSQDDALRLWHRTVVINGLLLFPTAAIVAWYAEPLVVTVFGASYRPAIPALQWYALVIVCACVDFSPLLRAVNKTRPFVAGGVIAAIANGLTLVVLLPRMGIVGAAVGLVVANFVVMLYLGFSVSDLYGTGARRLLPWTAVAKVGMCAVVGAVIAFGITFEARGTLLGAAGGSVLYGAVFVALLRAARLEEANALFRRLRSLAQGLRGR